MLRISKIVGAALIALFVSYSANAANILPHCYTNFFGRVCDIIIDGEIERGDGEKFSSLVSDLIRSDNVIETVYLMSPGGLIDEAMQIGTILRNGLINTESPRMGKFVPFRPSDDRDSNIARCRNVCFDYFTLFIRSTNKGYISSETAQRNHEENFMPDFFEEFAIVNPNTQCASACALIFLAGIERRGTIGVHHIFLPSSQTDYSTLEEILTGGTSRIRNFLTEMRITPSVVERIFSTESREISWLETYNSGATDPIFQEYLNSNCNQLTPKDEEEFSRLSSLRRSGAYFDFDARQLVERRITNTEIQRIAELEGQYNNYHECIGRTTYDVRRNAQSILN